tara:strand:- start:1454 stop:1891 length:438 start_codon:yes stop_codon:yes gene_type:complete
MSNECIELENIKYQTMLLNGNSNIISEKKNTINIENILNRESNENKKKPWNKLGHNLKVLLLKTYAKDYCKKNSYNDEVKKELIRYFLKCLERKKLTKIKEVLYDQENNIIKNIPNLFYDSNKYKFTLKTTTSKKTQKKSLKVKD